MVHSPTTNNGRGKVSADRNLTLAYITRGKKVVWSGHWPYMSMTFCSLERLNFQNTYMQKLKDKYPFKHWKVNQGEFLGRYLQKNGDGSISVNQKEYCEKMKTIELSRERRREKNADLTEKERSQLRGVAGALNWITTATRPDMAAATASVQAEDYFSKGWRHCTGESSGG